MISPDNKCSVMTFSSLLSQEQLQLLQRQLEEREVELRRLKDGSRLRVESPNRAEGGERGGVCCINRTGEFISSFDIRSRFLRIRQIHITYQTLDPPPASTLLILLYLDFSINYFFTDSLNLSGVMWGSISYLSSPLSVCGLHTKHICLFHSPSTQLTLSYLLVAGGMSLLKGKSLLNCSACKHMLHSKTWSAAAFSCVFRLSIGEMTKTSDL